MRLRDPITPALRFRPGTNVPLDEVLQKHWLDRAARNAGWMIFGFLRDDVAAGRWPLTTNECEIQFPRTGR